MAEVRGAFLLGLAKAAARLGWNPVECVEDWQRETWYSHAALQTLLQQYARALDPVVSMERLGEEFALVLNAGKSGPMQGLSVPAYLKLRHQAQVYQSFVRGSLAEIGTFELVHIDAAHGQAMLRSTSLLPRHLELGWLHGGLRACSGMLYYDVRLRADMSHLDVLFVSSDNRQTLAWEQPVSDDEWRNRNQHRQQVRLERFCGSADEMLVRTVAERDAARQQLAMNARLAALGTVTAGMAHEINNPANFAHVGAQALALKLEQFRQFLVGLAGDDADADVLTALHRNIDELLAGVDTVLDGTDRVRTIVRDLRKFTRIDAVEKSRVPVACSLAKTVELVRTQYAEVVDFHCQFDANPMFECWADQLSQVFMNMIVNACQAIEKKQKMLGSCERGAIRINSRIEADRLLLEFSDDGCGIPAHLVQNVFDPFFTTKQAMDGTGLGLAISSGIVAAHGGTIEVQSREHLGTSFLISFPLADAPAT